MTQDTTQVTVPLSGLPINNNSAASAFCAPVQSENELRAPLRDISYNNKDLLEQPEQEQDIKQQDNGDDGLGNINEYVARIMEKLEKQKQGQENVEVDMCSKENMSPVKSRLASAVQSSSPVKEVTKYKLEEVLHISKHAINFGNKFPGQVAEEHFDIVNKSDNDFVVRIEVDCLNEELQDTEEYVYSVRRSHLQEYNDRHYLIMAPYSCASFKFALKVPNMKTKGEINGQVRVSIEDLAGSYNLDMHTTVCTPKVFCPKELRHPTMNYSVIKLAVKEGKKQDFKLPIKNNGPVPVTMDFDFYEPKNENDSEDKAMFDLIHPAAMTVGANGSAQLNVSVKPWKNLRSKKVEKNKPMRKVLLGKVRDSAIVYSFVFAIEFY